MHNPSLAPERIALQLVIPRLLSIKMEWIKSSGSAERISIPLKLIPLHLPSHNTEMFTSTWKATKGTIIIILPSSSLFSGACHQQWPNFSWQFNSRFCQQSCTYFKHSMLKQSMQEYSLWHQKEQWNSSLGQRHVQSLTEIGVTNTAYAPSPAAEGYVMLLTYKLLSILAAF